MSEEPTPGRRKSPKPRSQFSRAEIVEAAMHLTRDGVSALTMRRLARELDIDAAALYYHFQSKAELTDLIGDAILDAIELPGPEVGDWSERLRHLALAADEALNQYPGLVPAISHENPSPAVLRIIDYVIGLMRDAGFTATQAYRASAALMLLSTSQFRSAVTVPSRASAGSSLMPVGGDRTPYRSLADVDLGPLDSTTAYEFGVELLIEGLRAILTRGVSQQ